MWKIPQSLWCFYCSAGLDIFSLMPSTCVCVAYQWQFFTHNHQNKNSSRIQKSLQSQKICNHRDHLFWVICNITTNQLIYSSSSPVLAMQLEFSKFTPVKILSKLSCRQITCFTVQVCINLIYTPPTIKEENQCLHMIENDCWVFLNPNQNWSVMT